MKGKYLDKRVKKFIDYSILIIVGLAMLIGLFIITYNNFTVYNTILLILIVLSILLISLVLAISISAIFAYKRRRIGKFMAAFVKAGMNIMIPVLLALAGFFNKDKDAIRSLYIEINNILVQSRQKCFKPEEILVILPHCLQNTECKYKITHDTSNCKRCGKCTIGRILDLTEKRAVKTVVVTGGTAARNSVVEERPKVLLSVACERDLASGIHDVGKIPAIGILNERPFGPCKNTTLSICSLEKELDELLCKDTK
jgi:hypothetical protein